MSACLTRCIKAELLAFWGGFSLTQKVDDL